MRPKIGDIIEIKLDSGRLAYAQYVFQHQNPPRYGALLRVLPGTFKKRPIEITDLVARDEQFSTFFPLSAGLKAGDLKVIGNATVPRQFQTLPTFKSFNEDDETGSRSWFLWNGKNWRQVGKLRKKQIDFPRLCTVNFTQLQEWIESGYTNRTDVRRSDIRS